MMLLALSPLLVIVPVSIGAAITGVILYARRQMEDAQRDAASEDAANDSGIDVEEKKSTDTDGAGGSEVSDSYKCKRTGQVADVARWSSPAPVIAALEKLGYKLNSLTSKAGREEVMKFQTKAIAIGLMGLSGADSKWVDGVMGGCTLVALSAAMNMYEAGNWPGA